jgi:hypothetical protein
MRWCAEFSLPDAIKGGRVPANTASLSLISRAAVATFSSPAVRG